MSGGEPLHPMAAFGPSDDPGGGEPTKSRHQSFSADQDNLKQPRHSEPAPDWSKRAGEDFAWLYRQDTSTARSKRRRADTSAAAGCGSSYLSSYPPVPVPPPSAPRSRNPMIFMIVILLCLTAGAVTGIALLLQSGSGTAGPLRGVQCAEHRLL